MLRANSIALSQVTVDDSFWNRVVSLVRVSAIPYQWNTLNDRIAGAVKSHCVENFRIAAGVSGGEFHGMVFQDSDLYKWLESVAYSLATHPDAQLEAQADEVIALIAKAQQPDGYLNTYYTLKEPDKRWSNLQQGHELYCAGHLIEAAVAYFDATGKRTLLDVACRFAQYISEVFGTSEGQIPGYPGHQNIEQALCRLYRATGQETFLQLAQYFIDRRGQAPNFFDREQETEQYAVIFPELQNLPRTYSQSHLPVLQQDEACGHAVRAVYMYAGMAELAGLRDDKEMLDVCVKLYESIVGRRMYITGAIGSTFIGESFTAEYDLPDDAVYGETCASVGLMMFCQRMHHITGQAHYIDTLERALYNTVLAGMSLSGQEFFYVNPLSVNPVRCQNNPSLAHVKTVRQRWYACSCCPPNIARTVMSLGSYAYSVGPNSLYVNLYVSGQVKLQTTSGTACVTVTTDYPFGDSACLVAGAGRYAIKLRSPAHAPIRSLHIDGVETSFVLQNGYIELERDWHDTTIALTFDISAHMVYVHPQATMYAGKAAVMRGPLVYCVEQVDNGPGLCGRFLAANAQFTEVSPPAALPESCVALKTHDAFRLKTDQDALYGSASPGLEPDCLMLIPYYLWANRGENEMQVFLPVQFL